MTNSSTNSSTNSGINSSTRYCCYSCNTRFDLNVTDKCPTCGTETWYNSRLNLILLIDFLEGKNVPFSVRDLLFNPESFTLFWERMVNA